jgi:SAM-dependent methyltransferase
MTTTLDWQGKVGSVWAQEADTLDLLLGPSGNAGLIALGDIENRRVLDLGCGAGHTTLTLAKRGARTVGVDISSDLLDMARMRDIDGHAEYLLADAGAGDLKGPYDALYSRCGAMFFDDPIGALSHIRSAMKKGAPMSLVAWAEPDQNGWAQIPLDAAHNLLHSPRIGTGPGPFAWANQDNFVPILKAAGWKNVIVEPYIGRAEIRIGDSDDPIMRAVDFAMRIGPMASRMKGCARELRDEIREILYIEFEKYLDKDMVLVPTKAWIIKGLA